MATKNNTKSPAAKKTAAKSAAKKAAAPKKARAPKEAAEKKEALPRHPKARLAKLHNSKADLAKTLAGALVAGDEDSGALTQRLTKASNSQLLRLQKVVETVKSKYGSREKLIAAIGSAQNKGNDKDYLAKLATYPLPRLLDLAPRA
ncbi:MAG: hypothetical protein JO257_14870 [Deltaproteobacteria bacterium]|nr:hypothetical protein [Deltaproteobacteria bacterium]